MSRPKKIGSKVVPMAEPTAQPPAPTPTSAAEATTKQPPVRKKESVSFYDNVRKIPTEDWGKRAWIYGYCIEPVCNLKAQGENKYMFKSGAAILDEDGIMKDYGSGRYRLNLVYRKPANDKGDEVDSYEFEIFNPKFPPKIPRAVWMNDPRNERWAALLPKEEPVVPPTPLGSLTDAFKVFGEMRRDLRGEIEPPPGPPPVAQETSMSSALQMVQTIMAMKADNPMVEIMKEQLRASNEQAEKAREREAALQRELREQLRVAVTQPAAQKNGVGQIKEYVEALKELGPTLKDLIPGATAALDGVRGGRTTWLDIVRDAAPTVLDTLGKVIIAAAQRPAVNGTGTPPIPSPYPQLAPAAPIPTSAPPYYWKVGIPDAPATQTAQPMQPSQPTTEQRLTMFLQQNAGALMNYLKSFIGYDQPGGIKVPPDLEAPRDFASWVDDGYGDQPLKDARSIGSERILAMFKSAPAWPALAHHEAKLLEFIDGVLAWQPEMEDEDDEKTAAQEAGVDLTQA